MKRVSIDKSFLSLFLIFSWSSLPRTLFTIDCTRMQQTFFPSDSMDACGKGPIRAQDPRREREKRKREETRGESIQSTVSVAIAKATASACPRDRKCEHPACSLKNEITLNTSFSRTMPFNNSWIYAFEREKQTNFTRYHIRMKMKEIDTREQCTTMNVPSLLSRISHTFVAAWCCLSADSLQIAK